MNQNHHQKITKDIFVTYKPAGISTHRVSNEPDQSCGFVEWLEARFQRSFYLFHRLDAATSGILLLAETKEAAADWTQLLQLKKVNKQYLFITKINLNQSSLNTLKNVKPNEAITIKSLISKKKGTWCSEESHQSNSETRLTLLKSVGVYQLWKAQPVTGKTHQIRLHAQSLGIPILGDTLYGGAPFYRLCLHAWEIQIANTICQDDKEKDFAVDVRKEGACSLWRADPPPFFSQLELISESPSLCSFLGAMDLRDQLIQRKYLSTDSYRLVHSEFPAFRIDRLGDQFWVYDYISHSDKNTETSISKETLLQALFQHYPNTPTWVREMQNRGQQPNQSLLQSIHQPEPRWIIIENQIHYEMRADQGMSPGLFLDQRENRHWIRSHSQNRKVLNLFSYTCGFSLNAALGGASEVVSVDVSQAFLNWGKKNFELNALVPANYEFWAADSIEFLRRTLKIKRRFDLIICDPPSFGRSNKGVFNIEKDLSQMIALAFQLLNPSGLIFISTNYERWDPSQFKTKAIANLLSNSFQIVSSPPVAIDFLDTTHPLLKNLIIERL